MTPNDEMVQGFLDGYNLDNPEPNANRSRSYRHGFKAGRNDKLPYEDRPFKGMDIHEIHRLAEEAMRLDQDA